MGACLGFTDGTTGRWWVRGFPEGTGMVDGRDRAEEGVWAPDFQDGSSALHSHTEGLPGGGVCPVAPHAGSVGHLA